MVASTVVAAFAYGTMPAITVSNSVAKIDLIRDIVIPFPGFSKWGPHHRESRREPRGDV
jgi:hypothetical protein